MCVNCGRLASKWVVRITGFALHNLLEFPSVNCGTPSVKSAKLTIAMIGASVWRFNRHSVQGLLAMNFS